MEQLTPRGRVLYRVYSHFHPLSPCMTYALQDDARALQEEADARAQETDPMTPQVIYKKFWPPEDSALASSDKTK